MRLGPLITSMLSASKENRGDPRLPCRVIPFHKEFYAMSHTASLPCTEVGVGIDTHRYFHQADFLYSDAQPAAAALNFEESAEGYAQLRQALERIESRHPDAHFRI